MDEKFVLVEVEFASDVDAAYFNMDAYYPDAVEVSDKPEYSMKNYWMSTRKHPEEVRHDASSRN